MDIDTGEIHQTILEINEVEEKNKIHYLISRLDKLKAKLEELQDYDVYLSWDDGKRGGLVNVHRCSVYLAQ